MNEFRFLFSLRYAAPLVLFALFFFLKGRTSIVNAKLRLRISAMEASVAFLLKSILLAPIATREKQELCRIFEIDEAQFDAYHDVTKAFRGNLPLYKLAKNILAIKSRREDLFNRFGVPQHKRDRYEDLADRIDGTDSVSACGKLIWEFVFGDYGFNGLGIKEGELYTVKKSYDFKSC